MSLHTRCETGGTYLAFWDTLTPQTTRRLHELARPDLHFRDPFSDIRGAPGVVAMLDHMFEKAPDATFAVTGRAQAGRLLFARWRFACTVPRLGRLPIEGVSEIHLDEQGLVVEHLDHWDAAGQVYERIPLLGRMLRGVRGRFAFTA